MVTWRNGCFEKMDDQLVHTTPNQNGCSSQNFSSNHPCGIKIRPPTSSFDLCLPFCISPSSMPTAQWAKLKWPFAMPYVRQGCGRSQHSPYTPEYPPACQESSFLHIESMGWRQSNSPEQFMHCSLFPNSFLIPFFLFLFNGIPRVEIFELFMGAEDLSRIRSSPWETVWYF